MNNALTLALQPDAGQEMPALGFSSLTGDTVQLAGFNGQPTVVNLWATWCPPCVREMPVLQKAQADRPGVNVVFLNQGESPDKVGPWLRARNLVSTRIGELSAATLAERLVLASR